MNISKTNVRPIKNFLLIEPLARVEETTDGLVMPEATYSPAPVAGTVLRAGKNCVEVKEGDVVFFRRFSVDELAFTTPDGSKESVSLISEEELCGVVEQ